jgi:hypothetical protein
MKDKEFIARRPLANDSQIQNEINQAVVNEVRLARS